MFPSEFHNQGVADVNFYIGPGSYELLHKGDTFFSIEEIVLVAVYGNDDKNALEYSASPLDDVEMPVGWRIERSGENSLDHAGTINRSPRGVKACRYAWSMASPGYTVYHTVL